MVLSFRPFQKAVALRAVGTGMPQMAETAV
jgi:hypothetical protein